LLLAVLSVSAYDAQSASAQCAAENSASLEKQYVIPMGDTFYIGLKASWDCKGTPFILAMSTATGTINVQNVRYIPQYLFPAACSGSEQITVVGQKTGLGPHLVNAQVDVGPTPYNARSLEPVLIP
jgi:hypothetical protein